MKWRGGSLDLNVEAGNGDVEGYTLVTESEKVKVKPTCEGKEEK